MSRKKQNTSSEPARNKNAAERPRRRSGGDGTPVVAVGASAGGLEALRDFFSAMPADSGMAFVVVQHLDPAYESRTAEILAKHTSMRVLDADDRMPVEADSVYAIPSGKYASLDHGRLRLSDPIPEGGIRKPIDFLLTSVADERLDKAVAVILSGSSGTDGLKGARAIRAAGGICLAQDPQTARFPQMPQSIIEAGLADYVLPADKIPAALLAYARHASLQASPDGALPAGPEADGLESILELLHTRANRDYRNYKRATILRRIYRRMGLRSAPDTAAYLRILRADPEELAQLAGDLLIGVSSFFRDPEAFEALRCQVAEPLAKGRDADAPLRAWVAGCATGEEAYSVAMLLMDAVARAGSTCPVQVFASDVDEKALETARAGVYSADIALDVSEKYLTRFFTRRGDSWQVSKKLRETIIFSRHNLLVDPPFSRLDLVCCRNVLIYLLPAAQKKVLTLFSFSLNTGGYLFLGKSEGLVGIEDGLFEPVSRQKRIYRLVRSSRPVAGKFPLYPDGRPSKYMPRESAKAQPSSAALYEANQEALTRHFQASVVLIDPHGRILYFHGQNRKVPRPSQRARRPQPPGPHRRPPFCKAPPRHQEGPRAK